MYTAEQLPRIYNQSHSPNRSVTKLVIVKFKAQLNLTHNSGVARNLVHELRMFDKSVVNSRQ